MHQTFSSQGVKKVKENGHYGTRLSSFEEWEGGRKEVKFHKSWDKPGLAIQTKEKYQQTKLAKDATSQDEI